MLDVDRNGEEEAIGLMVVLKYTDDDVLVDKSTVVMDGLVLPRTITIVKGGLLVAKPPSFPVRLVWSRDNQFDISQSHSEKNVRSDAEENVKFLSLPIYNEISGSTRTREVDLLDGSIKDKFKKGLGTNEIANPPAVLKSLINYDGSSSQVEIPPPGFNMGFLVVAVFICVFEPIFLTTFDIPFLTQTDVPGVFMVFAATFGLIFLGVPTWFLIRLIGITFVAPNRYPSAMKRSNKPRDGPFGKREPSLPKRLRNFSCGRRNLELEAIRLL